MAFASSSAKLYTVLHTLIEHEINYFDQQVVMHVSEHHLKIDSSRSLEVHIKAINTVSAY